MNKPTTPMQKVLNLQPRRTRTFRAVLPFCALSALLVWIVRVPPTLLFWSGVISLPIFLLLQIACGVSYRWLLPRCRARLNEVGAKGLAAYMQQRLVGAYHGAQSNTWLVVALTALNLAAAIVLLTNALLIATVLWEWLAFFAFGSALLTALVALESSKIVFDMLGLLMRRI